MADLFSQALKLIGEPPERRHDCRCAVFDAIWEIKTSQVSTAKEVKGKLLDIAEFLEKAMRTMEELPESVRLALPPRTSLLEIIGRNDSIAADKRAGAFLITLDAAAHTAKRLAAKTRVRRTGRAELAKQVAAESAWDLLERFGQERPTLTRGGTFPKLADTLYEDATGKADDLFEYCRAVYQRKERSE
jgi:hypothetical protein